MVSNNKLCNDHELINIFVNDCNNTENHQLDIIVSDLIDIDNDMINMVLCDIFPLPKKMKSFYNSIIFMDYLMSLEDIGNKVKKIFDETLEKMIQSDIDDILYLMGTYYKYYQCIDHRLINKLIDTDSMKYIVESVS